MNDANIHQSKYDKIRSKTYNRDKTDSIKYQIGDLVLNNISRQLIGNKKKFTSTWIGPYEIIKILGDKTYEIRKVDDETHATNQHERFLKPYKVSPYINTLNYSMMMIHKEKDRDYNRILNHIEKKLQLKTLS